jgi:hypothetical protein
MSDSQTPKSPEPDGHREGEDEDDDEDEKTPGDLSFGRFLRCFFPLQARQANGCRVE